MKTQVIGQLGMEGGGEDVPLPHGNGEPVDPGEYLHAGADLFNERRSDEHGFEGRLIRWIAVRCGERAQLQRSREAVDLPPEGVPAHGSVQEADARLSGMIEDVRAEQDKPRTRAEYGHPAPDQLAHTVHHAPFDKELAHDRAFAAGKHEAGETFEVFPRADFHGFGSAETERADVFSEGPLNGQHADARSGRCGHRFTSPVPAYAVRARWSRFPGRAWLRRDRGRLRQESCNHCSGSRLRQWPWRVWPDLWT